MDLGRILMQLRKEKNVATIDLAKQIGVSSSHISQIERNKSSPSITILKKIANALDVPITYFFSEEEKNSTIIKKNQRKKLLLPDSNLTYELLSPTSIKDYQLLLTKIEVGGMMGDEPIGHAGDECCYMKTGSAEFIVNDEAHLVHEGDTIYIPENAPHNVINKGDKEVTIISVISPARF